MKGTARRQFLEGMRKPNGSFDSFLVPRGIDPAVMADIDDTVDETMTDTIYDLYRDATPNLYAYNGWGPKMEDAAATPGLIVAPDEDPYGSVELSERTAERLKASFVRLPGKSHYWMHQDPDAAAKLLQEFWDEAGR